MPFASLLRTLTIGSLLATLVVSGCGWAEWPPPRAANSPPPYTLRAQPAPRPEGSELMFVGGDSITVAPGDTVYAISQRFRVSPRALIEANRLEPPYRLLPGQRLVVPRERVHAAVRGDTLYGISRRYGVDMYELAQANRLEPPYTIHVGQELRIPAVPQAAGTAPVAAGSRSLQVEELTPPPAARQGPAVTMVTPPAAPVPPPVRPAALPPGPAPVRPAAPALIDDGDFIWPTRGQIILDFGPKAKGLHNDGINIEAPRGTPVHAAAGGVVAYAGNELRGFGNLLLIKHADGWVTAYAHNDELLVNRGDTVGKGQVIARVGSTGNVTKPQLHFELRKGRQAVDPRTKLTGQLSS